MIESGLYRGLQEGLDNGLHNGRYNGVYPSINIIVPRFSYLSRQWHGYHNVQLPDHEKIFMDNYIFKPFNSARISHQLDRVYWTALSIENNAKVSLINPSSTPITTVGSPVFTPGIGWACNGTDQRLDTNWAPSSGVTFTQNSGCVFTYVRTNSSLARMDIGAADQWQAVSPFTYSKAMGVVSRYTNGRAYPNVNDINNNDFITVSDSLGFYASVRTASNVLQMYKRGTLGVTATDTSVSPTANNMNVNAIQDGAGGYYFSSRQQPFFGVGGGSIDQSIFYRIIQNAMIMKRIAV